MKHFIEISYDTSIRAPYAECICGWHTLNNAEPAMVVVRHMKLIKE